MRNKSIQLLLLICYNIICIAANAQNNNCNEPDDKKVLKLLDKANNKDYDIRERISFLNETLEIDADCLPCNFQLGISAFKKAKSASTSFSNSLNYFKKVESLCKNYHADVYYYLGTIAYSTQDYDGAQKYYNQFLEFPTSDVSKLAKDHKKKVEDVKQVMPDIKINGEIYGKGLNFNPLVVTNVSTANDEYLPMLSPDNELLFYTRKKIVKEKGDIIGREVEELTLSKKFDSSELFNNGEPLKPPFNVGDNYGGITISVDNKDMIVTVCKPGKQGYNNCDLYSTKWEQIVNVTTGKKEFYWAGLENLGPAINTEDGWEAQPSLSGDGKTLYFATARESTLKDASGIPGIDIFYSTLGADAKWAPAKTLGTQINTNGNDKSPFMHSDSKTLYFSSTGYKGVGGYDIYFTKQNNDGAWSVPKNIGYPINSNKDEHGLIVSTDGRLAYYASGNLKGVGGLDVYSFELPTNARPDKVLILKGEIKDEKGEIVKDAKLELKYAKSKEIREIEIDIQDGRYAAVINLQKDNDVIISVKKDGLAFNAQIFSIEDTIKSVVENVDIKLEKLKVGKAYKINDIKYATNSADINASSKVILDEFALYLIENKTVKIAIHGHTDNIGEQVMNLALSSERAFEVFSYLQSKGVTGDRMNFEGFGQNAPIADNNTEEGRFKNRRTEFMIVAM
jgi:outer membrane protein OmpA-like peptidoglycan-associated protein